MAKTQQNLQNGRLIHIFFIKLGYNYLNIYFFGGTFVFKKTLKYISLFLAALLMCGAILTSCSDKVKPIKSTKEEMTVVGSCGDYEVLYEELRYVNMNYKKIFESNYGADVWQDAEKCEELKNTVLDVMTYNYAVLSLCKEVGISANDKKIQESVQKYIEQIVEAYGGMKEYKKALKGEYLTDHYVRFNAAVDTIEAELFYVYTQDLELIENDNEKLSDIFLDGGCARTLHVFVKNDKGESVEDNRALAAQIRQMYLDGTSMDELIGEYNQDFTITTKDGLYFTYSQMEEDYEKAAFATHIGGVSEVVEASDGFYVIFRLEPEEQQVLANFQTLKEYYQYGKLADFIEEKQAGLAVELNDFGKSIDFVAMK